MDKMMTTLDIEDLSAKQLRKILNGIARSQLPYSKKSKDEQDKDKDEAAEENDSLVSLHRETKGDSKPPKVLPSDLPAEEEDEEEENLPGKKKAKE